ncbi:potassium uptake protein, TrkH family [Cyclonatronum proteinivorum]|uniref:Potassium uptake protein, TrkH family n=1 Tax=Cyclonatronum proteinivorum TaxID=1457365 RepID=A0A345UJG9_9BACT|nr:potassium transporter TrkG [Cyclonatronum proteinivorum]AXJ00621.1 potassium uptake protein, TrkH family [Cyclonatronum proteinivorum]
MRRILPYGWRRRLLKLTLSARWVYGKFSDKFRYYKDDLYEFNRKADRWLHYFSVFLGVAVFVSLLIPFLIPGEQYDTVLSGYIDRVLLISFGVFFYVRLFLSPDRNDYVRSRWPEGAVATLALLFGTCLMFFGEEAFTGLLTRLGVGAADQVLLLVIKIYLVLLVVVRVVQAVPKVLARNVNAARLVLFSFLSVIVAGTLFLMLPAATVDGEGLGFVDALFMSTSAVCVTGLIVVDTATHLTRFGQGIILVLIQLGGIGVVTFTTFLTMSITGSIGLAERKILKETISGEEVNTVAKTMKRIVLLTFSVEFVGLVSYYLSWTELFPDRGERFWFALFHTVSAFCNAGFSVFSESLADSVNATSLPINLTTMVLIIIGGLGFTTVWESISRMRGKSERKQFSIHSQIVFRMTAFLIVAGALLVLLLEWNGVLQEYSFGDKLLLSVFQSVTSRTAGFNTLDTGALSAGATLIVIILMAIGASPSSTAGGLKTTTVYVLYKSMLANVTGADRVEIANRTVPNAVVLRAITAVFLAFGFMTIGLVLLTIVEDFPFLDILFEQVSAFMTVGLSRGITDSLSDAGKTIIIFSMFAGRVGMLTVAVAFAARAGRRNYKYPEEAVMVA